MNLNGKILNKMLINVIQLNYLISILKSIPCHEIESVSECKIFHFRTTY